MTSQTPCYSAANWKPLLLSSVLDHWLTLDLWPLQGRSYSCYYHCLSCDISCSGGGSGCSLGLFCPSWSWTQVCLPECVGEVMVAGYICGSNEPQEEKWTEQTNSRSPWCLHFSFHFWELENPKTEKFGCSSCGPPQWMMNAEMNNSTLKLSFLSFLMLWIFGS